MSYNIIGYVDSDGKLYNKDEYGYLSSASPVNNNNTRAFKFNKDKGKLNNKYNRNNARPCLFLTKHSFPRLGGGLFLYTIMLDTDKLLTDLFQAYYDTRQHKRNTKSAVDFEMNYESKIIDLRNDLVNGTYVISPSICFIIQDPVQREVFAADFRDRIVHHLIYNYIYEIFDRHFIYDSYSCRLEKGTHFGIKRVDHFIRSCTQNYTRDAYILKLDIKGFFMHIDKHILFEKIKFFLSSFSKGGVPRSGGGFKNKLTIDCDFLINLIHQVIFHDSTKNCIIKGKKTDRDGLPDDKSLFHSSKDTGLAIGNLTSQLFANVYLDSLDKYIKYELGFSYYGRYVDDFIFIDTDKQKLLSVITKIKDFLSDKLHLTLHPKKIYFQQYSKGVQFLGAYIKPHRTYIRKRTIGNFYKRIQIVNKSLCLRHLPSQREKNLSSFCKGGEPRSGGGFDKELIQSVINSYLGILNHYKTFKIRKKVIGNFFNKFGNNFHFTKAYTKAIPNIRKLKESEVRKLYSQGYYSRLHK
ncbi:MAG: RNA-directed DNA polymerase [candidate division SR1 bacterium]|nr:RNA-directed DNA polymerase [candidate division SR1 bacterium]